MRVRTLFASLVFCMASFGVAGAEYPAFGQTKVQAKTISTDGMNGISLGMSRSQVAHLINRRGEYDKPDYGKMDTFACNVFGSRDGLVDVMIERGIVTRISTTSPRLKTLSGAMVGMPEGALKRLYGNKLIKKVGDYSGFDYYFYSSDSKGIRFHVENGRIRNISVGRRPSIEYSEGCL